MKPDIPTITPEAAAARVAEAKAVLIDVREPLEWADGVATPAVLLSLTDLKAGTDGWERMLADNADKELILYCKAGGRAGNAATLLATRGLRTTNMGGFSSWKAAGLPVRLP